MKTTFCSALCLTLIGTGSLCAQPAYELTRITEGALANDLGNSTGCAWGDYDRDGNIDIIIGSAYGQTNRLYRNNGDGSFTRITTGTIVNEPADADAVIWGDYDNDGDLDLFVSNWLSPIKDFFYRNLGDGTFVKITQGDWVNDSGHGDGSAWADYDADGFLDLYVTNTGGQNDFLYRNNGDGTMIKISSGPVPNSGGESRACTWLDYDGDGDLDLIVANGGSPSGENEFQFRNEGNGTFTRISTGDLVADGGDSNGIAAADYDNDGDLDVFVSNRSHQDNRLYRNQGTLGFIRVVEGTMVTDGGTSIGPAWGDYDNDGYVDLFVANDFGEDNFLYHNEGDGTFSKVIESSVVTDGGASWGCAWGDYDNDGDLDLIVANGLSIETTTPPREPCFLYQNSGGTNAWILVRLTGTASNRSAIGAKVWARATIGGKSFWQLREISGGSGWCSQNDLRAHFGLGDADKIDTLRIEWPSGIVQELKDVTPNQILTVTEPPRLLPQGAGAFRIQCWINQAFGVEASTDLTGWSNVATVTNLTGTLVFEDAEADQHASRYYRVVAK